MALPRPSEMRDDFMKCPLGERGGDHRNYHDIRRAKHLLASFCETGRAIEKHALITAAQPFDKALEALALT